MTISAIEQAQALALAAGAGETITGLGVSITYKVPNEATGDAWALLEYTAPPHFAGPPPHWHARTAELFYILDGTAGFTLGEQAITATRGASVYVPPGVVHTFFNPAAEPLIFLAWLTPGEFAEYFKELFALVHAEPSWPPTDRQKLAALIAKYDQHAPPAPRAE